MTKEQVYQELKEKWKLFDMNNQEIKNAYNLITGLDKTKEQTMLDLKEYLLEYVLDRMIYDGDIDNIMAANVLNEVIKQWK